jgi:translocation and assembly module TamB
LSAAPSLPPDFRGPEQAPPQEPPRRPLWKKLLIGAGILLAVVVLLVVIGIEFVLHSSSAHNYILKTANEKGSQALATNLQVGNYGLSFSGISPTLDLYDVTIAGAAPYATPPLLRVDHMQVGVRVVSILSRKWYLSDVVVNRPVVHVFVDKQGNTNLPKPKSSGGRSNTNIFDLAIRRAVLDRGEIYYNDRKSVVTADLHDLDFQSSYDPAPRYFGKISYSNGHLQMSTFNTIGHDFSAGFEYAPDKFTLRNATLHTGSSHITVNALVRNFANPTANAEYDARLDAGEFRTVLKNPTLPAGLIDLNGKLQYVSRPNQPFLQVLELDGTLASKQLQVITSGVRGVVQNVGARYSLKNGDVDVKNMHANVLGGDLNGTLAMRNIAAGAAKSHLAATLRNVSLAGLKTMVQSPALKQVALIGNLNADADATWGKTLDDLSAHANASVNANVAPSQAGGTSVPMDAVIHASYSAPSKIVTLANSYVRMPQTSLNLNGTVSDHSSLEVRLQANDLHQLEAIGAMFQTKPAALGLYGTASFNGTVTGSTSAPRLTGQLHAANLRVRGSSWRLLRTNVDVSPTQSALHNGELDPMQRGRITFNLRAGLQNWSFTDSSPFEVALNVNQLNVQNLVQAAGSTVPVSGTLNVDVQAHGSRLNPVGNGAIELSQAEISGEPIQSATLRFQGTGDTVHTELALRLPAGQANGAVDYFPKQHAYDANLRANNIRLEQLQTVKANNLQLTGVLNLTASGRGTIDNPLLVARAEIPSLTIQNQSMKGLTLQTNVANHVANVALDSQVIDTNIRGRATVQLRGDYETTATLDTQPIPFAPLVAAYAPAQAGQLTGQTELHATLRGPLKRKESVEAHLTIPILQANYQNAVRIAAPQPIHADYMNGVLTLQRSALRGTGTDLQFQGRVPVLDKNAPVALLLQGTLDLRLAQILNPDIVSSGQLQFDIDSFGQFSDPNVQGQVRIVNAAFATGDAPLGLRNGNGLLTLTRNRLDIATFKGQVGGGNISARGGVIYRPTIGFDLAVSADNIRLLYPAGVRSGIAANIVMTGTPDTAYLRGTVDLDQLSFTPDFDLMDMMGQFGGTTSPPPSRGFTNNLQLQLALRSPQGINLSSRELSLAGGLNLQVRGTAAQPVILGRVNLTSGDLIFRGNRYLLQGATLDFINPATTQPVVNAALDTTIQQYNIAMRFEGPVDKMRTSYTSDPALPPADIINLLAFGKTTEASAANPNPPGNLGAESMIAGAVAGQVTNRLQKVAGISQLSIDPTLGGSGSSGQQNPGATITLQQRVTSKIFVTFSTDVTSTNRQVIQLEYRKSPRFSFSGTRDQNGGFAVDTKIRKKW